MHHHGTAAWMLVTCAVFLGCASCSYGPASLFFYAPYFIREVDPSTNTTSPSLLYCAAIDIPSFGSHQSSSSNHSSSSSSGRVIDPSQQYSLAYLECAFLWSNISTGFLHLVGALIVGFGGVFVFSNSSSAGSATSPRSDSNNNNNVNIPDIAQFSESGVGAVDDTTGQLPGEKYYRIFYVSVFGASFFGLVAGILSLPSVSGPSSSSSETSSSTSAHVGGTRELLLWIAVSSVVLGSCFIGAAMLSLMAGVALRWPNLYDVLFEGAVRGIHASKPRKVNRVKEKQEYLNFGGGVGSDHGGVTPGKSPNTAGRSNTSRMMSSFDVNEEDTVDYLHLALTTPPTIIFACYIAGWAVSFFFANVALLSVAGETQTRSAFYAFFLLCACPAVSYLVGKMADCCSVDEFESLGENNNNNNESSASPMRDGRGGSGDSGGPGPDDSTSVVNDNSNNNPQHSVRTLASVGGRSLTYSTYSGIGGGGPGATRSVVSGADGLGWNNNDFSPDFYRSSFSTIVYSIGEVTIKNPESGLRYEPEEEQLPRRLALRVVRSLRIFGTYLLFILLPTFMTAVISAQVKVASFSISIKPAIANHIYNRLNILTLDVPMMFVWWLVLYLMTKAVFLRSGLLKYIMIGFSLAVKAAFTLFPLQIIYNKELPADGSKMVAPNPNAPKEALPQLTAVLTPFFSAASQTQLNIFTIALAFCVLPRPMFPIAIAALSLCWGLGELSAIRVSATTYDLQNDGFLVIAIMFILSLATLIIFLLIVRWKNGFANPRALLTKFKQEAVEEAQQRLRQETEEQERYHQDQQNQSKNQPKYGSVEVPPGPNSTDVSPTNDDDDINNNNSNTQQQEVPLMSSSLAQRQTTTRGSYSSYDVLPPHRLLHWSPSEIDTAFTVFDSTESVNEGNRHNNMMNQYYNNQHYGGGGAGAGASSLGGATSTLGNLPTSNATSGLTGNQQQQQPSNLSQGRPPLPFSHSNNNNNNSLDAGLPRKPKKNSTPRADSDLKYYAVRRNSARN